MALASRLAHDRHIEGDRQACRGLDLSHELVECRAARLLLRGISAFESGIGVAGIEARAHLPFDHRAELALDRVQE